MPGRIGEIFGSYELIQFLGHGGFAEVYLGKHTRLPQQMAAIKILNKQLVIAKSQQFQREASIVATLRHPNIVQMYDYNLYSNPTLTTTLVPYIVMEYAPNKSLRVKHPRGQALPLRTIITYTRQVADALQYAHEQGVMHLDVKPENILINAQNKLLLSDFGLATLLTEQEKTGDIQGTLSYMSPEQLDGKPTFASDQYALAVMVYEWLSGRLPFTGQSVKEVIEKHLKESPPSLRVQIPTLSQEVEEVIFKALEKNSADRFHNIEAFAVAFDQAASLQRGRAPGVRVQAPVNAPPTPGQQVQTPPPGAQANAPAPGPIPPAVPAAGGAGAGNGAAPLPDPVQQGAGAGLGSAPGTTPPPAPGATPAPPSPAGSPVFQPTPAPVPAPAPAQPVTPFPAVANQAAAPAPIAPVTPSGGQAAPQPDPALAAASPASPFGAANPGQANPTPPTPAAQFPGGAQPGGSFLSPGYAPPPFIAGPPPGMRAATPPGAGNSPFFQTMPGSPTATTVFGLPGASSLSGPGAGGSGGPGPLPPYLSGGNTGQYTTTRPQGKTFSETTQIFLKRPSASTRRRRQPLWISGILLNVLGAIFIGFWIARLIVERDIGWWAFIFALFVSLGTFALFFNSGNRPLNVCLALILAVYGGFVGHAIGFLTYGSFLPGPDVLSFLFFAISLGWHLYLTFSRQ